MLTVQTQAAAHYLGEGECFPLSLGSVAADLCPGLDMEQACQPAIPTQGLDCVITCLT